jgi:hypothetical protein
MKKNLNKIPDRIRTRLQGLDQQDDIVVACVKLIRLSDVDKYTQLGLTLRDGKLNVPAPFVPRPQAGRYSHANIAGHEKKRHDLPMVPKDFSFDRPNWGDPSRGSHGVVQTRQVYQVDFYPPKEITLSIALLESRSEGFVVKFEVDQVLRRHNDGFERDLLYNLNLLQENVGAVNVFPSVATLAEYATTVHIDWQILPPGTVDEVLQGMLRGQRRTLTPDEEGIMRQRIALLLKLQPMDFIAGSDEFLRYFGARFGEDFVVFENLNYGNAIYLMRENWRDLSKKSRVELLAGDRNAFDRIEHREGWEERLETAITQYRGRSK